MPYSTTDPAGAKRILENDPEFVYLDVRTVEEFEAGHVPGSFNVPLLLRSPRGMEPNPAFLQAVARRFPRGSKLILGCKSGGRSQRACELLENEGYAELVNMAGGFHGATDMLGRLVEPGWLAAGFESARQAEPGRSWRELAGG